MTFTRESLIRALRPTADTRTLLLRAAIASACCVLVARSATATVVGGGGNQATDCLTVFDAPVNDPPSKPRNVRCVDGDPCDADGTVNGVCEFALGVCANSTFDPACGLNGVQSIKVEHSADNGDPKFDPQFQALNTRVQNEIAPPTNQADSCTAATNFRVEIKGPFGSRCKKNSKLVKLTTFSNVIDEHVYTDKDRIKLTCDPAPTGCDPHVLFPGGTFDRIQQQIFNQSCAVSGCHDSQTQMANLLLETGSSLANLVNVTPTNAAAMMAGWKRVTVSDPMTGDPDTSLLYHKVNGPPAGFGERMPFMRKKLDGHLVEVIRLWIAGGAPANGWVPGTD
jgi:hypothetical protein